MHCAHEPHSPVGRTATKVPSAVKPPNSWPRITPESPDEMRCRSDPQMPADETVMSSPIPVGSSWSVTKTEPEEDITARIAPSYY